MAAAVASTSAPTAIWATSSPALARARNSIKLQAVLGYGIVSTPCPARATVFLTLQPHSGSCKTLLSAAACPSRSKRERRAGAARAEVGTSPTVIKVVGISGSFRKASWHQGLLRASQELITESFPDLELEILDISKLPFVNTDIPKDALPEEVRVFRAKVLQANAILFSSPEYNYSVPGVLKNAIDWGSYPTNVWGEKAAAIVSAGGGLGGGRGQAHLRQMGIYIDIHFLNRPELFIKGYEPPQKFNEEGDLVDPVTKDRLKNLIDALRAWAIRLQKI